MTASETGAYQDYGCSLALVLVGPTTTIYHNEKTNGYVLFESPEQDYVVIATGFSRRSENPKTGNMIQIWILNRSVDPIQAIVTGQDKSVCLDCPLRGTGPKSRSCYVSLKGVWSIWRAWKRGSYPVLAQDAIGTLFENRTVRFGACGEPVLLPLELISRITSDCSGWTGYTHQWRQEQYQPYRRYFMASVDTTGQAGQALTLGWRYFRIRRENEGLLSIKQERVCPASEEAGKKVQCVQCLLCNGSTSRNKRNVVIIVHGMGRDKFVRIGD